MNPLISLLAALALTACSDSDVMREIRRSEAKTAAQAELAVQDSAAFLEAARAKPGAEALQSGLVLERRGRGGDQSLPMPPMEAVVLVHYEGRLANGEVFDSSFERGQPAQFPLQGVVPGFAEAITHMRPGDEVVASFPAELGYGARGQPPVIPPNAALQFRIVLLGFATADGTRVMAPAVR